MGDYYLETGNMLPLTASKKREPPFYNHREQSSANEMDFSLEPSEKNSTFNISILVLQDP